MSARRMTCPHCPRYDRDAKRCLDGKANPRRKADSVVVAEMLGVSALCHYNPYREGIALRTFFPHSPFAVSARVRRPRFLRPIIEIIEDDPVTPDE